MIHDLDVVSTLVGEDRRSRPSGSGVDGTRDIANARLRFPTAASPTSPPAGFQEKVRKLRFFEPERYVSLDYQKQEAISYRLVRSGRLPRSAGTISKSFRTSPSPRAEDFLHAVATGESEGERRRRAQAFELALEVVARWKRKSVKGDRGMNETFVPHLPYPQSPLYLIPGA
jgi:hypothetical protein